MSYPLHRIATDGYTTCLWHRQHQYYLEHVAPTQPRCTICGGNTADMRVPRHELCRAREERGMPTPLMDSTPLCGCNAPACRVAREGVKP